LVNSCADLKGRRVLVVEDEFLLAMELEGILDRYGCEVLGPASSVERALAALQTDRPEVVVLDVNLKGRRATPVAAALRDRGVPFVLMTGYSGPQLSEPELRDALRLDKPVDGCDLKRAVVRVLQAAKPAPDS
jgi:DNA-binding NtrC family response regulator